MMYQMNALQSLYPLILHPGVNWATDKIALTLHFDMLPSLIAVTQHEDFSKMSHEVEVKLTASLSNVIDYL